MKFLVDTPVWSIALRRKSKSLSPGEKQFKLELADMVRDGNAVIIGPVRQEVLSGLSDEAVFEGLRDHLRFFDDEPMSSADFEEAARCSNRCRAAGVAGTAVDFTICAVAIRCGLATFTTDDDFTLYAEHLPIALHAPSGGKD